MARHYILSTDYVDRQSFPPHIHEFLTVSASYLGVRMDSMDRGNGAWRDNGDLFKKQNDSEVGYAANHV